ncbi:MAG: tetratricopeptide repeat protein [bacterium]
MDPRPRFLLGILVFLGAAFVVRTIAGPSPAIGRRINHALDAQAHGHAAAAARELESVLQVRPEDSAGWLRAGRALTAAGEPHDGAERLRRAVELNPASLTARYELAKALMAEYLDDEAEAVLADLFRLKPDHADGLYLYAEIAAARGDVPETVKRLEQALAAGPSNPDRYRKEPRFDPVRADLRFVHLVRDRRFPSAFGGSRS